MICKLNYIYCVSMEQKIMGHTHIHNYEMSNLYGKTLKNINIKYSKWTYILFKKTVIKELYKIQSQAPEILRQSL